MRKRTVYISLPITDRDMEQQRARAAELAERIREKGMEPVNPFDVARGVDADMRGKGRRPTWYDYMGADIASLLQCDAILLDTDANAAYGCCIELAVAQAIGRSKRKHFAIFHTREQWDDIYGKFII